MSFTSSWSLKRKLAVIGFLPMFIMISLAGYLLLQDYELIKEGESLLVDVDYMDKTSTAAHYLQIERGASITYLKGGLDIETLRKIRAKHTSYFSEIKGGVNKTSFTSSFKEKILLQYNSVLEVRNQILSNQASPKDVFVAYTSLIGTLFLVENKIERLAKDQELIAQARTLHTLEEAKESGGIFRAKFSGALAGNKPMNDKLWYELERRIFLTRSLLTGKSIQLSDNLSEKRDFIINSDEWKFIWSTFNGARELRATGGYGVDAKKFFNQITNTLNILNSMIELTRTGMGDTLKERIFALKVEIAIYAGILLSFILAISGIVFWISRSLSSSLGEVAIKLNDRSTSLSCSSMQVTEASGDLSGSAIEQAEALHQTVSAIDEINAMVTRNSESAQNSQEMSGTCDQVVSDGRDYVNQVERSIDDIKNMNEEIVSEMTKSNDEFAEIIKVISEISEKTQVINDIVFQTKLLSFNASVEAARAGEHGKGFAVVAEEVGNLASMSGKAADEITEMLNSSVKKVEVIVNSTKLKVDSMMTSASDKVGLGQKTVEQCAGAFEEIRTNVNSMSVVVSEIAAASKEQALGVTEVSEAVNGLDQITQKTTLVSRQAKEIAQSLTQQSEGMGDLVNQLQDVIYGKGAKIRLQIDAFEWRDEYMLRVQEMDEEHKILVGFINKFIDTLNEDILSETKLAFQNMCEYTIKHFADEEAFMASMNYQEIDAHKRIHTRLLAQMGSYGEQLERGELNEQKLVAFLKNWLVSHIMGVDMKYADQFNSADKFSAVC